MRGHIISIKNIIILYHNNIIYHYALFSFYCQPSCRRTMIFRIFLIIITNTNDCQSIYDVARGKKRTQNQRWQQTVLNCFSIFMIRKESVWTNEINEGKIEKNRIVDKQSIFLIFSKHSWWSDRIILNVEMIILSWWTCQLRGVRNKRYETNLEQVRCVLFQVEIFFSLC